MNQTGKGNGRYLFVFLEIFACEGGIQAYVKDIFRAYQELATQWSRQVGKPQLQAEVLLLRDRATCKNPFENSSCFQFRYLKSPSVQLGRLRLAFVLWTALLLRRPQRVFCGHINLVPLVRLLCQPLGIPYTVLTYGKEVWEPLPSKYQAGLRRADSLWSISRYSRDRTCASNQIDPDRVQMVPCVVDGDVFTPGDKPAALLERYCLQDSTVLMTVARLWSGDIYKGVDVTIRALPKIVATVPNLQYLVIGRGDDQPRLMQLAQELGIADRVVFAGFVPTEELVDHYHVADAYVMPSQEGFGIVYLEAMACGLPVLSGDADGSADPLQDGRLGWQVPHRDPDAVAVACLELLAGNDRRCDGQWLRQEVLAQFSFAALSQQLEILLQQPLC